MREVPVMYTRGASAARSMNVLRGKRGVLGTVQIQFTHTLELRVVFLVNVS